MILYRSPVYMEGKKIDQSKDQIFCLPDKQEISYTGKSYPFLGGGMASTYCYEEKKGLFSWKPKIF